MHGDHVGKSSNVTVPAFNSQCPYHARFCKCTYRWSAASASSPGYAKRTRPALDERPLPRTALRQDRTAQVTNGVSRPPSSSLRNTQRPLTIPQPPYTASAAAAVAQHWVESFCTVGVPNEWLYHVPHFVERDDVIRKAAKAVLCTRQWRAFGDETARREGHRLYGQALKQLKDRLRVSCEDLVTVAIFARYEHAAGCDARALAHHLRGMTTLLLSRDQEYGMAELSAAFLYMTKLHRLFQPLANGEPSPFDNDFWLEMKYPQRYHNLSESAQRLEKSANQCYIRIPKLVASLREVRTICDSQGHLHHELASQCLGLILKAMESIDSEAEKTLMEREVETETKGNDPHAGHSLQTLTDLIEYWESRLFVLNIARAFLDLMLAEEDEMADSARRSLSLVDINDEQEQLVRKVLKSVEAFESSTRGALAIPSALIAVWGALPRLDNVEGVDQIEDWIFTRLVASLDRGKGQCGRADLDRISDLFVGGPIEGVLTPDVQLALLYHKY